MILKIRPKPFLLLNILALAAVVGLPLYRVIAGYHRGDLITQITFTERPLIILLIAFTLATHFLEPEVRVYSALVATASALIALVAFFRISSIGPHDVDVASAALLLGTYSVSIFVILNDILLEGAATYLTQTRGEKWVKELDYVYLALGGLGLFGTLDRTAKFFVSTWKDGELLGPIILATAIVVRLIKTRVEIGGWNKLQAPARPRA